MTKDSRFYLRLADDERARFDDVAGALGLKSTSDAIRFVMAEKHRELFGVAGKAKPGKTKAKR